MTESEFLEEKQKILKSMPDTICFTREEAKSILEELERYRSIGTVEECREAVEKQRAKKPKSINKVDEETVYMECDNCGLTTVLYRGMKPDYCPKCGQGLNLQDCFNEQPSCGQEG